MGTMLVLSDEVRQDAVAVPLNEQTDAIQLMLDLEAAGMVTPVALVITDPNLPFDKAEAVAAFWGSVNRRCSWYIGDLMLYCEAIYGHEFPQIAAATGLTEPVLAHRMFVAQRIPPERRLPNLSFSVHALVARKPPAEQAYWLNEAAKHGWGYAHLREQMREVQQIEQPPLLPDEPDPAEPPHDTGVNVALLLEATHAVIRDGVPEDGFVKVPVESFERLRAAFNGAL